MSIRTMIFFFSLLFASSSFAVGKPFEQAAFSQAQKDGKSIVVLIHADWCRTCQAQAPIVEKLSKSPEFSSFTILRVDFDKQKDVVHDFGVRYQSTIIVFKGTKEMGRALAITQEEPIAELMKKGI